MGYKVSVIIPVFNADKYLTQCIESLLAQSLKECEFIFVNDGSIDDSRTIIERFMKSDNRIRLINQKNQGVSAARNRGVMIARGQYIGFVDADDFIRADMFETLYGVGLESNCDMVISNFESFGEAHSIFTRYPFSVYEKQSQEYIQNTVLPYFLQADDCNTVCNKLFKNEVISVNRIEFPKGVALGEDGLFNMHFLSKAASIIYIDYSGYIYREVNGSATRNISEKDYFARALEVYSNKVQDAYVESIHKEKCKELKSLKLIKSVMAYIHVYFEPCKELSFSKRYLYIKDMISNNHVRNSLPIFYDVVYQSLGRYDKLIIYLIGRKSALGLYIAVAYSRYRNK